MSDITYVTEYCKYSSTYVEKIFFGGFIPCAVLLK